MSGCIITIDAMGCQKQSVGDIIRKEGGYVLSLKENHPEVYAEVVELFSEKEPGEAEYTEITKDRGRIEKWEA